jgi:hypothetical protein
MLDEAKRQAEAAGAVDLLEDDEAVSSRAPGVIVSTGPTELVQTDGPPQYAPIGRTDLLFVSNSPNRLFLDLRTQTHYVLLAGRWYRTPSLARGPWDYVPGPDLPAGFAMIPDGHPTEGVRVAVPGTPQAQEAAIANGVPEFATVKRSAARLEITYDGPPQFRPIEGTRLEAAVNAPVPVIRVDWRTHYALDNGVWFFSDSPDGPWTAATSVPPVVYTIPRSDPLHYVTYVRVYDATPEVVYVGYRPGYVGSYATIDGTVVYGSGWYYRPWIGTVWYATPVTWGFGFSFWYSWWDPWPHRVWWGGWRPVPCFRPAWGAWAHRHVGAKHSSLTPTAGRYRRRSPLRLRRAGIAGGRRHAFLAEPACDHLPPLGSAVRLHSRSRPGRLAAARNATRSPRRHHRPFGERIDGPVRRWTCRAGCARRSVALPDGAAAPRCPGCAHQQGAAGKECSRRRNAESIVKLLDGPRSGIRGRAYRACASRSAGTRRTRRVPGRKRGASSGERRRASRTCGETERDGHLRRLHRAPALRRRRAGRTCGETERGAHLRRLHRAPTLRRRRAGRTCGETERGAHLRRLHRAPALRRHRDASAPCAMRAAGLAKVTA